MMAMKSPQAAFSLISPMDCFWHFSFFFFSSFCLLQASGKRSIHTAPWKHPCPHHFTLADTFQLWGGEAFFPHEKLQQHASTPSRLSAGKGWEACSQEKRQGAEALPRAKATKKKKAFLMGHNPFPEGKALGWVLLE